MIAQFDGGQAAERFYIGPMTDTYKDAPSTALLIAEGVQAHVPDTYTGTMQTGPRSTWIDFRSNSISFGDGDFFKLFVAPPRSSCAFAAWVKTFQCVVEAAVISEIFRFKACVTPTHLLRKLACLTGFLFNLLHGSAGVAPSPFSMPFPLDENAQANLAYVQGELKVYD